MKEHKKKIYPHGYSIIEMVISVTILVVLITVLANIFLRFTRQSYDTGASREVIDQARDIVFSMKQNLDHAIAVGNHAECHDPDSTFPRAYSQIDTGVGVPSDLEQIVFINANGECSGYVWKEDTVPPNLGRLFQIVGVTSSDPVIIPLSNNSVNISDVRFRIFDEINNKQFPRVQVSMTFDAVSETPFTPLKIQFSSALTF